MLNFDFLGKGLKQFLEHILCMILQEKCFSCYILLTDQILLADCLLKILINICLAIVCLLTRL